MFSIWYEKEEEEERNNLKGQVKLLEHAYDS